MTDEDAFLAAVRESPLDDTPRLAFADWLDEHDRPDRARFIRVQVEAWKMWCDPKYAVHCFGRFEQEYGRPITYDEAYHASCSCAWCSLRREEWAIIAAAAHKLYGSHVSVVTWPYGSPVWRGTRLRLAKDAWVPCKFRRGFIAAVEVDPGQLYGVCEQCGGRGFYGKADHDNPLSAYAPDELTPEGMPKVKCRRCGETGNESPLADLFRVHPITRVTLVGQRPYLSEEGTCLWSGYSKSPYGVPGGGSGEVWLEMYPGRAYAHETAQDALDVLSFGVVNACRKRAGLPPIPHELRGEARV